MDDRREQVSRESEGSEWIVLKQSPIHGTGAFAAKPVPKGTRIVEYRGERIQKRESMRRCEGGNEFIFSLSALWDLDGNVDWNPARFLNHACSPNAEAEVSGERIWIVAAGNISAGEEVTFNYGFDLENYRDYPCRCGSPGCVGFIVAEEFFAHVRAQNALRSGQVEIDP
jgi:uncharacterized protein